MVNIYKLLVIFFILFGCVNTSEKGTLIVSENPNNLSQSPNEWKQDSMGCLRFRNLELAKKMIVKNNLISKSKKEFIEYFGQPNEVSHQTGRSYLVYYIETICKDKTLVEDADKCWIQFTFEENELKEIPNVVACE